MAKQVKNPYLQKIVLEMKENIDHGVGISETMTQYPKVFDTLTIALISV
jgi:type II secretory pathway component PulF